MRLQSRTQLTLLKYLYDRTKDIQEVIQSGIHHFRSKLRQRESKKEISLF